MISNNPNVFAKLEPRISSSLDVDEIQFKPYTIAEMKDILAKRIDSAFSSVENGAAILAANHAVKNGGDVRTGLKVLQKAGRLAEKEGDSKLKVSHLKKVIPEVGQAKPEILKRNISEGETEVLSAVEKIGEGSFGEVYEKYAKRSKDPVSERMFQEYVKHLGQLGLIKISDEKIDHKRIISKV